MIVLMNELERFGKLIRDAREAKGLRADVLAARIGLGTSTMSNVETGKRKSIPEPDLVNALHRELGIPKTRMLEALGYLTPVDAAGEANVITVRSDDPRATMLRVLEGLTDAEVLKAVMIIEVVIDSTSGHKAESTDTTERDSREERSA